MCTPIHLYNTMIQLWNKWLNTVSPLSSLACLHDGLYYTKVNLSHWRQVLYEQNKQVDNSLFKNKLTVHYLKGRHLQVKIPMMSQLSHMNIKKSIAM